MAKVTKNFPMLPEAVIGYMEANGFNVSEDDQDRVVFDFMLEDEKRVLVGIQSIRCQRFHDDEDAPRWIDTLHIQKFNRVDLQQWVSLMEMGDIVASPMVTFSNQFKALVA